MAILLSRPAVAAPLLDQEYFPYLFSPFTIFAGGVEQAEASQTFTVGVTGMMTSVDLYVFSAPSANPAPLLVDIRKTVGGVPILGSAGPHILASAEIPKSAVPDLSLVSPGYSWLGPWLHVELDDFQVTAGEQLAVTLRSVDTTWYQWFMPIVYGPNDPIYPDYAGGNLWTGGAGEPWFDANVDAAFRTYVVPEPAAVAMLAPLAALALRRLHSRRRLPVA